MLLPELNGYNPNEAVFLTFVHSICPSLVERVKFKRSTVGETHGIRCRLESGVVSLKPQKLHGLSGDSGIQPFTAAHVE